MSSTIAGRVVAAYGGEARWKWSTEGPARNRFPPGEDSDQLWTPAALRPAATATADLPFK